MLNSVKKVEMVNVVEVSVPKKLKLRPWVKLVASSLVAGTIFAGVMAHTMATPDVHWVTVDAHPGDGYERLVRSVNGNKPLDIKAMSQLMMDKNHNANIIAYHSYKAPVLEGK